MRVPKYFLLNTSHENNISKKMKSKKIKFPLVLKPVSEGSSLGVYICKNKIQYYKNYEKNQKSGEKV